MIIDCKATVRRPNCDISTYFVRLFRPQNDYGRNTNAVRMPKTPLRRLMDGLSRRKDAVRTRSSALSYGIPIGPSWLHIKIHRATMRYCDGDNAIVQWRQRDKSAERRQLTYSNLWQSQQSDVNSPTVTSGIVSRATSTHLQVSRVHQLTFSNLWQSKQSASSLLLKPVAESAELHELTFSNLRQSQQSASKHLL
ncbi:hypothetical protein DPMN_041643 [Dreissena polymorpha]|uniref:Uncharacterized protein n=1 Tax=Dreissena polymorpha TaxID=45954 RepID=A0A9D4CX73_DREPO|nr:hypothetical protein DPMN_041643 [Dreissena polymorpha]